MAFLVGSFGKLSQTYMAQKLRSVIKNQKNIQTITLPHGTIIAGQNPNHTQQYNEIFTVGSDSILIGKVFDRNGKKPSASQHCIHNPTILYQHFWGRFVAALYNKTAHTLTLARDHLGLSTLFYIKKADGILFSTDIALLYDLVEPKPTLDFSYFAEHIINVNQALPSTPFKEIKELLPGMTITIDHQGKSYEKFMWNIAELKGSYIANEHEMEEELSATLKSSIKTWTKDSSGICVELSGGLDSSAVLITLREILPESTKLVAVNFIDSATPSSNENEYAKEVADICNVPLHLLDWRDEPLITDLPSEWRPNKPSTFLLSHSSTKDFYFFATAQGCSEFVNGQGGDHIFIAPPTRTSLADYWFDRGYKGATAQLNNISAAYRTSWPSLIYESTQAVIKYYRGKHTLQEYNATPFLEANHTHSLSKNSFYLQDNLKLFYPAKAIQIKSLSHAVTYADRDQRFPQAIVSHPLLLLPIVETALKIPTYQSFNNTYDRIFFRRAATKMRASKALWRTVKGQTTGSMSKACASQASLITELLLNGTLVKSGIINKNWLEKELISIRHGKADNLWPLLHMITSQLWLNQWEL